MKEDAEQSAEIARLKAAFGRGLTTQPVPGHLVLSEKMLSFDIDLDTAMDVYMMPFAVNGPIEQWVAPAAVWSLALKDLRFFEVTTHGFSSKICIHAGDDTVQAFFPGTSRWKLEPLRAFRDIVMAQKEKVGRS